MSDDRKLFVGQLPDDITEDEVKVVFGTYGPVSKIHMMDGKGAARCAFVHFDIEQHARDALDVLNEQYKFRHDSEQPIRVSIAKSKGGKDDRRDDRRDGNGRFVDRRGGNDRRMLPPTMPSSMLGCPPMGGCPGYAQMGLPPMPMHGTRDEEDTRKTFVGNLPQDIREEEVRTIFNTYGAVVDVSIIDGKRNTKMAFVTYDHEAGARTAIQALNNVYRFRTHSETPIRVEAVRVKDNKLTPAMPDPGCNYLKLYVGNLPPDVREDEIRYIFQTYGNVVDCRITESKQAGRYNCAFVTYTSEQYSRDAAQALNNIYKFRANSDGPIRVEFSKNDVGYAGVSGNSGCQQVAPQMGNKSRGLDAPEPQSSKLFVGQLPMDIREEEIATIFGTYGQIIDVSIMDGKPSGISKIAFVEYANFDQCRTAMATLDENYRFRRDSERPIRVCWATPARKRGNDVSRGAQGYGQQRGEAPRIHHGLAALHGRDQGQRDRDHGVDPSGPKLHIGGLPPDIQRDALETVFGHYGALSDVHIMPNRSGGPCAAFVLYDREEDAEKAHAAMQQGYEIRPGQGNIAVTYAFQKERSGGRRYQPY